MVHKRFSDCPPAEPCITPYDEAHLLDYLDLLDAATAGTDWRAAAFAIFGLDPSCDQARAKRIYDSHLARARWMTEIGYAHLLGPPGRA